MVQRASFLRSGAGAAVYMSAVMTLAAPPRAHGQGAGSATLSVGVTDGSDSLLPGATLTLVSQRTKLTRSATTDARGNHVFVGLVPDTYRVEVERSGFTRWRSGDLRLGAGDNVQLATRLLVGGRTEEVTVEAGRELLRTDSGAREETIRAEQIQNLSIVGRSAVELLRILPGVVSDPASYETVGFGGGANDLFSTSVNGTRGTTISPVLDGSKIVDFGGNSSVMVNINPDMVDEVKVQTSNYAAQYGSAGVQITAVTKGGASSFRGSLYDYWRNWRFAANDRSNVVHGVPRPRSDYQYPGFSLSGPVLIPGTSFNKSRDKLFFFVGLEYQHQIVDPGTSLGVVPTLKQRQGDFSEMLGNRGDNLAQPSLVTIPGGFPGAGDPAPNNDLRPYLDPFGRAILNMYPQPNYSDPDNRYNYAFNRPEPVNRAQLVSRLDWNASEKTHAYVRLALEREKDEWARGIWGGWSTYELPTPVQAKNRSWSLALNVTSVLSPSLTNELIISGTQLRLDNDWKDPSTMTLKAAGLQGFRGVFDNQIAEASLQVWSGGQQLGGFAPTGGLPVYAHNDSLSLAESLTKVRGAHNLKLGLFVERGQKQQNFDSQPQGLLSLESTWIPGGTGNDYGDLLVGRPASYYQSTLVPRGEWRFWNLEGYVQDSWKVRRNLTLEAGLRAAKLTNNEELNGLGVRFDPSAYDSTQGAFIDGDPQRPNGILLARRGEIPKGLTPDPGVALMPRLNVAWDVKGDGDVVVRGGAGLFYNRPSGNFQYFVQKSAPNTFNTFADTLSVDGGLTLASLPGLDPYSRPASSWVDSPDSVRLPRTWNWSLGVAKRLPGQQTLEVAYVGNRADHLPDRTIANYIVPGTLTGMVGNADLDNPLHRVALADSVAATFRKYPAYSQGSWWWQYEAVSHYNALQATLSRSGRRIQYFINYTFSKVLGTSAADYAVLDPIDARNRSYGVPWWDRSHILNASYSVELPDPLGSRAPAILRALLNGWQISGITSYQSGQPLHLTFSGDILQPEVQRAWWGTDAHNVDVWNGGTVGSVTPILLGNPQVDHGGIGEKVFDIDKVAIPALGESGPFQSPYYLRGPSRWNFDISIFKNFKVRGTKRIQLRAGFFDLFNQAAAAWTKGDVDLTLRTVCNVRVDGVPDGAGGTVDKVCDPRQGFHFDDLTKQDFGKIVSKHGHRVIEVAARFDF
jgi:Carboxypeptidase regulatory-like domain/TonB-dependent Receptor Plug Domain